MPRKKQLNSQNYSFSESLEMLTKLQKMSIEEGNLNLALKAEELKCKIATMQADKANSQVSESLTKVLVDFINDKQNNSKDTQDICPADASEV